MDQRLYNNLRAFYHRGRSMSVDDNSIALSDTFGVWLMLICDVVGKRKDSVFVDNFSCIAKLLISTEDPLALMECLDACDSALLQNADSKRAFETAIHQIPRYKTSPRFMQFFLLLQYLVNGWFCRRDTTAFADLHQIFSFPLRLTLEGKDLEDSAIAAYRQTISSQQQQCRSVGDVLQPIIIKWFPRNWEPTWRGFIPHHGPGVTSTTGRGAFEKNARLSVVSPLLDYYIRSRSLTDFFPSRDTFLKDHTLCYSPVRRSDLFTKIVFVPKNWKKKRTISAEPVSNLYAQQGIKDAILGFIHHPQPWEERIINASTTQHCHPLKRRYDPHTQDPNRSLSWEGSIDGSFATIDLSSASDSVTLTLVKNAFAHTGVLPALLCCRTGKAKLPNKELLTLTSYGPMGNALTFPVETIIFCACCEVAIQSTGDSSDKSRYVVYGDDIVIEEKYTDALFTVLKSLDFNVNTSKTFRSPTNLFRESCGAEWMDGADVTPVRISRGFKSLRFTRHNPGLFLGNCDMANAIYAFPMARRLVIDEMFVSLDKHFIPFSPDGEIGLYSSSCSNFQLEWKQFEAACLADPAWHHGIQRPVAKVWTATGNRVKEMSSLSESEHLFNWYCTSMHREDQLFSLEEVVPYRPWVPVTPDRLTRKWSSALYLTGA